MIRVTRVIAIGSLAIFGLCLLAGLAGARINTTRSIPIGLYWISDGPIKVGDYVMACPPPEGVFELAKERGYLGAGFCPGGYSALMKRVAALDGDAIEITREGVSVNGELWPASAPRELDSSGRPLPRYPATHFVLGVGEVLLMSEASATGFDGRYFGPVGKGAVMDAVRPMWTWAPRKIRSVERRRADAQLSAQIRYRQSAFIGRGDYRAWLGERARTQATLQQVFILFFYFFETLLQCF
ncbi:MAG: conjugative transfer signal peptidase TraF [Methylococcus sp.]|nr:conjugative transfer signal peptidase TraF [Methylococcus sp.]